MEPYVLRIILIVLGIMLLAAIYFYDRVKKRSRGKVERRRWSEDRRRGVQDRRRADDRVLPSEGEVPSQPDVEPEDLEREISRLGELISAERDEAPRVAEAELGDLRASQREVELPHREIPEEPDVPDKFIQINLVAREAPFRGTDIFDAAYSAGLEHGDMAIFHRRERGEEGGAIIYSMASMVEPGTFPTDDLQHFFTRGLTFFMQLPGSEEGLAIFSDMLFTAERLAATLNGEVQDQNRSSLTKQTIEHIRGEIMEHIRQVKLARMRR